MTNTVLSPPIPPYQNLPINAQYYSPRQYFIASISQGATTIVTTTVDNDYVVGQLIRLIIPYESGIRFLNGRQAYVISIIAPDQVEIDINSSNMDPFTVSSARNQPQILAIGDVNNGQVNANGPSFIKDYIPGSFINISPA